MNAELSAAYKAEIALAQRLSRAGRLDHAMRHLQRAHVLGQRYVVPHLRAHWAMFQIAVKRRSLAEGWGQAVRMLLGVLGSAFGVVPAGNAGGTDVSMFARMPIEAGIAELLRRDRAGKWAGK